MKKYSRIISMLLIIATVLSCANMASAYEDSTPKQEVVYANLASDGAVAKLYAVNIFDMDEAGQIIDYGDYSSVRNLNTDAPISQQGGTVRIDAGQGKLYYEGILDEDKALPWKIKIKYYLDGSEIQGSELAGADGRLQIIMDITENPKCRGSFFDSCGLQISAGLDTNLCTNIRAEGATSANAGRIRQLSYLVLPGKGTQIVIEADVTDFEMDEIMINALPLGMEIDLDAAENEGIAGKLDDLKDGAKKLDEGAADIKEGSGQVMKGAEQLSDGLNSLTQQNEGLVSGAYSVFKELAANAEVQLNSGLAAAGMSVTLTPETYEEVLTGLLAQLPEGHPASQSILGAKTQLDSYKAFYEGLSRYTQGVKSAADGSTELEKGAAELRNGAVDMKEGTADLRKETSDIDTRLEDEINKAIDDMLGKNFKVRSFVSSRNTGVESVQFIMKTAAIKKEEVKEEKVEKEEESFIDKVISLFSF